MKGEKATNWLQVATNLGVILGLVVLIYEVNQTNKHVAASLVDSSFQMGQAHYLAMLGEAPAEVVAKAHVDKESLSLEQRLVLDAYFQSLFIELEHRAMMGQLGIYGDSWTRC